MLKMISPFLIFACLVIFGASEASETKTTCFDCYKETVCEISSKTFLYEAIDIGLLNHTTSWLSQKYPNHDFSHYSANSCRRNRFRKILAALFNLTDPEDKPGCSSSGFCDINGCSNNLKESESSTNHSVQVDIHERKILSLLSKTILFHVPGGKTNKNSSGNATHERNKNAELKYLDATILHIPNIYDPSCLPQREFSTIEKVDLLLNAVRSLYYCDSTIIPSIRNVSAHDSTHSTKQEEYILTKLATLNRLVLAIAMKQPSYSLKLLQKTCGDFADDLLVSKAYLLKDVTKILVHCDRCSNSKIFNEAYKDFNSSVMHDHLPTIEGCEEQQKYLTMERHLSITRTLVSTFRDTFDCRLGKEKCDYISQESVTTNYQRIRDLLGCDQCNDSMAQCNGSRFDCIPTWRPTKRQSLHTLQSIARNTLDCHIEVRSFKRGHLERGLQNVINFHQILQKEANRSSSHQFQWPSCPAECNGKDIGSADCDMCHQVALNAAVSSLTLKVFNCRDTFRYQGQAFCKPQMLGKLMSNCLVSYSSYTNEGKEILALLLAVSSIIGCSSSQYGNAYAHHKEKCAYLSKASEIENSNIPTTFFPEWIINTQAFQPSDSTKIVFEDIYEKAQCSGACSPWELFCPEHSRCLPKYQHCEPILSLPNEEMYPLIGQLDMTSLWSTSFFISEFSDETIIVFSVPNPNNEGHFIAYLASGETYNITSMSYGIALTRSSYLKFHSHEQNSYGIRVLHYYRISDILRDSPNGTYRYKAGKNSTDTSNGTYTYEIGKNFTDGNIVNISKIIRKPRKAVLLINPIARPQRLKLKSVPPKLSVMEDSQIPLNGHMFHVNQFLDLYPEMKYYTVPSEMYPFIPRAALNTFHQYLQTFKNNQPYAKVVSLSQAGHWHVREKDEIRQHGPTRLTKGVSFSLFNSDVYLHPDRDFYGNAWLYLNVCYCNVKHQRDNTLSFNATFEVTPVNDRPITKGKILMLPSMAYNLTTTPNDGFLVSELQYFASDIDNPLLGIAVLATSKSRLGKWLYRLGNTSWLQLPIFDRSSRNLHSHMEMVRLMPQDKLKFELVDDLKQWSLATALKEIWLHVSFWDMADGKSSGLGTVSMSNFKASSSYSSEVFCYLTRRGCNGKIASLAKIDVCGVCGGAGRSCRGCDGVPFSGARFDSCGVCTGGKTNKTFNHMKDCAGTCGKAELDACNVCQKKGKTRSFADCMGVCFGKARINRCGQCYGGTSSLNDTAGMDICGVCNGDGTTCQGCDGVRNSGKVFDECGSCLLPSDSLFNSNCTKILGFFPRSSSSDGGMNMEVQGAGFSNYATVRCYFQRGNATITSSSVQLSQESRSKFKITVPSASPGIYIIKCMFDENGIAYESSSPTFKFYAKSRIKINGTNIKRVPINKVTNITIIGEGFDQTDEIFCVLMPGNNRPIVIEASMFNHNMVKCSLPQFTLSMNVEITVIASREDGTPAALQNIPSNSWFSIQIHAPAPLPILAQFSRKIDSVLITFDTNFYILTSDCWRLFRADIAIKFGKKPRCYKKSLNQMFIRLGLDAILMPGDLLVFNMGALRIRKQQIVTSDNATITVQAPASLEPPIVHIYGQTTLGSCESLRIKAMVAGNVGRRKSNIGWKVDFAAEVDRSILTQNETDDIAMIQQYVARLGPHRHEVFIQAPRIQFSSQSRYLGYEFAVNATNSFGQTSNEKSLIVERINADLPSVRIVGGSKRTVKSFRNLVLSGYARQPHCLQHSGKSFIAYQWEVSSPLVALDEQSKNSPRLFIPRRTLKGGQTYEFTLTASMVSDPTLFSSASVDVTVDSSPLVVKIKGGSNRIIGSNSDIILDASRSYDPDRDALTTESYSWECYTSTSDPCFVPDHNNTERMFLLIIPPFKRVILTPRTLAFNQTYTFVFTYNKGLRSASKTITIGINQGSPPIVFIRPQKNSKANSNRKTVIRGYVKSVTDNTVVWWECMEEDGFSYVDLTEPGITRSAVRRTIRRRGITWFVLVIKKDILENGATYKFRLQSRNTNGVGFAETTISVNGPPVQGTFTTDIVQGIALDTEFRLEALEGWIDAEDEDETPLTYKFGYVKPNGRDAFLGSASVDNEITTFLPAGEAKSNFTLTLFVDVYDATGARTRAVHYVQVLPPNEINHASVSALASKIETAFAANDLSSVIGQISSTVNVLNQAGHLENMVQVASAINISSNVHDEIVKFKENMTNGVLNMLSSILDRKAQDIVLNLMSDLTLDGKLFHGLLKKNIAQSIANLVKQQLAGTVNVPASKLIFAALEEEQDEEEEEEDGKAPEEVAEIMRTFENIINISSYDNTTMSLKKTFTELINSLLSAMCKRTSYGEDAAVSESILSSLQSYKYNFSDSYNSSMVVNCKNCSSDLQSSPILSLGEDLMRKYESWQCTSDYTCNGACLGSVKYPDDLYSNNHTNETVVSQVVQISLFNPESSHMITENQLISPMTILIPVKREKFNNSYSAKCKYWDDIAEEWKNDSCVAEPDIKIIGNTTYIVCKCTRTGTIAAFEGELFQRQTENQITASTSTSSKKDPLIPLYVVLGILGLAAICGGSFYVFKMRQASVQQTTRDA